MSLAKEIVKGEICAWCTIPFSIGENIVPEHKVQEFEDNPNQNPPKMEPFDGKFPGYPHLCEDCASLH